MPYHCKSGARAKSPLKTKDLRKIRPNTGETGAANCRMVTYCRMSLGDLRGEQDPGDVKVRRSNRRCARRANQLGQFLKLLGSLFY